MPPSAEPRNWLVEYTPMAVPLPPAGETLLISGSSGFQQIERSEEHRPDHQSPQAVAELPEE